MKRSRNTPARIAVRARRSWRAITDWIIARDVEEGWLLLLFAAAIGAAAGVSVILFYELIDGVRVFESAGWVLVTPDRLKASFGILAEAESEDEVDSIIREYSELVEKSQN